LQLHLEMQHICRSRSSDKCCVGIMFRVIAVVVV